MIFSKQTILKKMEEGLININPFNQNSLEEASYDLKLGFLFNEVTQNWEEISSFGKTIAPGEFFLAKTQENIKLSPKIACLVFTTSSLAQKGIDISQSSAFCHPKTNNQLTLEIVNHNRQAVTLKQGDTVAKLIFTEVI